MTKTAVSAAELYECDPTFAAGVNQWVADRRCPLALGDLLQELGLDSAADFARWAATEPDRESKDHKDCGPYPRPATNGRWYWLFECPPKDVIKRCHRIPLGRVPKYNDVWDHDTPLGAILWLLDNWVPA